MTIASNENSPSLQTVARQLDQLDAEVNGLVRGTRVRNKITLVLAAISMVLIGYWLWYAHSRFTSEVNPELAATFGQEYIREYLPAVSTQLETSLKDNAPAVVGEGEKQLRAVPAKVETEFRERARAAIAAQMPQIKDRLYESLKAGLADARAQALKVDAKDDEARFAKMAESLSAVYGTETLKFVDDVNAQYEQGAGNIVSKLTTLAEAKQLTDEQRNQRTLVRDLLILSRESLTAPPAKP